jgi:hypothetical protein
VSRRKIEIPSHEHNPMRCRICQSTIDTASNVMPGSTRRPPVEGDGSICAVCGEIAIFQVTDGKVTGLREPDFVELAKFTKEYQLLITTAADLRARRGLSFG